MLHSEMKVGSYRTAFEFERERPPLESPTGELEDQGPKTVTLTVVWSVEPEDAGRPSWDAGPTMEAILDEHGGLLEIEDDGRIVVNRAEDAMNAAYNALL